MKTINLDRTYNPEVKSVAKLLLDIFGTNPYYAQARSVAGEMTYTPIRQPLTEEILQQHLEGKITLGAYQLNAENMVNFVAWDVDSLDRVTARSYAEKIIQQLQDLPYAVEESGGKGYHILIFLTEPMPAQRAKQIVEFVRDTAGIPKTGSSHVETFPKQSKLTKTAPMGSLLKIPLGMHPKTHNWSRFIDWENGWEASDPLDPIQILQHKADPSDLDKLLMADREDPAKEIAELIAPHWSSGERHNLSFYLAGYLAHLGWGMQSAEEVIREIAKLSGDTESHNRVQAVHDTFRAVSEGKTVKGYSGLSDLLPGAVLRSLTEAATRVVTPTMVKQIDNVRLQKGAIFEKIRAVANLIWTDCSEKGEMVQTINGDCYWYNCTDHSLTSLQSVKWQAFLHAAYGINPAENFSKQVAEAIRLRAINEARTVTIQNRSIWTNETLYINLGDPIVYILDGEEIKTAYNGDCGFLFHTDTYGESIHPNLDSNADIWKVLVDDISFRTSNDAPAAPQEQRELLKAWILAYFFTELLPTKPLLLALGVPGSGKTTAIRRILKILESPDSDVLEVAGDKPDSLRASIASHKLLALDNLEKTHARWLVDTLNRLATGTNIELRQLYKTNETYVLKPNCFVAMSAVNMPFSDETLFSRLLPLEMQQLSSPLPEYFLQRQLIENMDDLWGDLLLKLNKVVKSLLSDKTHISPTTSRLADFAVFCRRISKSGVVNGEILMQGLRSLLNSQRIALVESSPFVAVLEQWLTSGDEEIGNLHTYHQLFTILEPLARARKMEWRWKDARALERHVSFFSSLLRKLYGAEFYEAYDASGKKIVSVRFRKLDL